MTDSDVFKKKRICGIHFKVEHKNRNNRLSALAVPLLHLPDGSHLSNIDALNRSNLSDSAPGEATILPFDIVVQSESISTVQPSTSTSTTITGKTLDENLVIGANVSAATVLADHNYFVKRPKRANFKEAVNNRELGLHQSKLRHLQNVIGRLRRKSQSFKERLASARKLGNNVAFNFVTKNMTKAAQLFVNMQLQSKKKPKGRRFSIEEKVLCLSLYKKSPKCYRLLCKYFALPSSKAMKSLLSQIKLVPGINPIIFKKLKNTLNGKDACDRLCSLIFDEMSITPQVFYNSQKDSFEGFTSNRQFTNHVLVFMVKGIKNNFKQPIAYYYTNSLRKLELKSIIKNVVKHTLDSGLIIVNTVCDQSTVNVGALTEFVNDTRAMFLRKGKEWRHDLFRVKGKNIIPLYDTSHLIKGLRNKKIELCHQ